MDLSPALTQSAPANAVPTTKIRATRFFILTSDDVLSVPNPLRGSRPAGGTPHRAAAFPFFTGALRNCSEPLMARGRSVAGRARLGRVHVEAIRVPSANLALQYGKRS